MFPEKVFVSRFLDECETVELKEKGGILRITERTGRSTYEYWVDFERELASSIHAVNRLFEIGVSKEIARKLEKIAKKVFAEGGAWIKFELGYNCYRVSVGVEIREAVPLPLNYLCFVSRYADSWNELSFTAEQEEVLEIIELVKARGVKEAAIEIARALALGGMEFLKAKNKLETLRNKVDELLRMLLEENVNRISVPFVFEVDGKYVVTTSCCTEYYIVDSVPRRKRERERLMHALWVLSSNPIAKERVKELRKLLKS